MVYTVEGWPVRILHAVKENGKNPTVMVEYTTTGNSVERKVSHLSSNDKRKLVRTLINSGILLSEAELMAMIPERVIW